MGTHDAVKKNIEGEPDEHRAMAALITVSGLSNKTRIHTDAISAGPFILQEAGGGFRKE